LVPIVSIHSYRGGTGKSNLTANLAWFLASLGKRIGVIDTDLQSPGVHMVFEFDTNRITYTLSDFLFGKCDVEDTAYDITSSVGLDGAAKTGRLLLLPASLTIEAITRIVAEGYDAGKLNDSLAALGRALKLDYILLDTHPGMNRETMLTTAISHLQLLLVRPDAQDFHGTAVLLEVARRLGVKRTFLIANKVVSSLGRDEMQTMVRDAFGAELIGCLPLSEEMASLGSRGLFCVKHPQHPIARELYELSHRMMTELG
jgi:MinD-like ATPase involved in chromosome partitioning or flagellar assembly